MPRAPLNPEMKRPGPGHEFAKTGGRPEMGRRPGRNELPTSRNSGIDKKMPQVPPADRQDEEELD
jgi:hypothetical protein